MSVFLYFTSGQASQWGVVKARLPFQITFLKEKLKLDKHVNNGKIYIHRFQELRIFYVFYCVLHFELGQIMFNVIARSYFPETPESRINISPALLVMDSKVISTETETFTHRHSCRYRFR